MADVTQVVMPQLGETVTEGTITRWLKQSGDEVAEDEDLFEVSTDKVDTTVPSAVSGVVLEILVPEGDTVEVGVPLATIGPPGSAAPAPAPAPPSTAAAPTPAPPEPVTQVVARATSSATGSGDGPAPSEPVTQVVARATSSATGSGGGTGDGSNGFLSPVVRRLLAEHQLDPATIAGTGAEGRITRDDVLAAAATTTTTLEPVTKVVARATSPATGSVVPLSTIRKRIAGHLTESLRTAAHALVVMEVDYSVVDLARDRAKAAFREHEGFGLTYLPFVARSVIDAIGRFPHVNSSLDGDDLLVHGDVNLGIAVDLDFNGLVVPVIPHADTKTLRGIARDIDDLARRARASALAPDDLAGGTFTLTNAGGYGTFVTAPIINQPQVAILSTDGVKMRPVAVALDGGGYGVAVHPMGNLALSFDHRVFDGAYASAFLAAVVARLEDHDWLAELEAGSQRGGQA